MSDSGGRVQRTYEVLLTRNGLIATALLQVVALAVAFRLFGPGPGPGSTDGAAIAVVWQVHAAFASIGFAGLAIAFQVLGDPPLSAGSARRSVVGDMRFGQLLVSGIIASLVIGTATLWAASPGTVATSFMLVFLPSVLIVGAAYARLAILFTSSPRIERLTLTELKQRVRRAAATAVGQEQQDRDVEEQIEAARGLVIGSLPSAGDLKIRRLRNPHLGQVVSAVNIGPMVHAADQLAWEAHQASTGSGFKSYDYPQRISVRARPNKQYRPGDTLFEMHDWPGINDATWEAISQRLFSGLRFTDDLSDDATFIFAEEMSALQDSVLAAVRDHQIARAARGYRYYQQTIHEARTSTGNIHLGLRDSRWFEKQIWEIDEAATRSTHRMAFVAISDAERMAFDAVKTEDLFWLRLALVRLQHIWDALLDSQESAAVHARENLLVTMQNLAELAIPYSFSGGAESDYASRQLIWTFASIAKTAVDAGEVATAERVLGYMGGLFDLSREPNAEGLGVDVGVGQAVVLAWILFSDERRRPRAPERVQLSAFPRRHHLPDAVSVLRAYEKYRDESPWRHWESADALPLRAHVLQFEGYFRRAVLLLLADGKLRLRNGSATWDDRHLLEATRGAVDSVRDYWIENRLDTSLLERPVADISRELERLDRERNERVASLPVSPVREEKFRQAIVDTMRSAPRLATFLEVPPLADGSDVDGSGRLGQILGGVPKDFFIESDVLASPSDLGHQVGAAVLREQDYGVLGVLLGDQQPTQLAADGLPGSLIELAKPLKDPVVVYNGQVEIEELLNIEFTADGQLMLAGFRAFAIFVGQGLPSGDFVVIDRQGLSAFAFLPEEADNLIPIPEVQLAVGIREEDADDQGERTLSIEYGQIARWARRNPTAIAVQVVHRRT